MKAKDIDARFDSGEDISEHLEVDKSVRGYFPQTLKPRPRLYCTPIKSGTAPVHPGASG